MLVNEEGYRVGLSHPRAKLSDEQVEKIRQLHDEGLTYRQIARKYDCSYWTVGSICRFQRRNQVMVLERRNA